MINKCNTIHFFSAIGSEPVRTINWLSFCFKLMSIVEGVFVPSSDRVEFNGAGGNLAYEGPPDELQG